MRIRHLLKGLAALLFSLGAPAQDVGQSTDKYQPSPDADLATQAPSQFARFVEIDDGGHLDTAITTYRNEDGVTVTLIGAVHIADPGHYARLQELFTTYDALLYELVAPPDHRPRPGETRGNHFVSILQRGLKNGLGLQFQLDALDYAVDNFVHADLDPESFAKLQEEKGESLIGLMFQAMAQEMKRLREGDVKEVPDALKDFNLVNAFRSGEGRHLLRMLFATQLQDLERAAAGFGGEDGSVLLEGRNERCLEVLQEQIDDGVKNLGIYYGAAHMPHMEKRLTEDLGFEKVGHEWIVAWDCEKKSDKEIEGRLDERELVAKARTDLKQIWEAAKAYMLMNGIRNIPSLKDLTTPDANGRVWLEGEVDDPWGNPYRIAAGRKYGRTGDITVMSDGPDGEPGTADDIFGDR